MDVSLHNQEKNAMFENAFYHTSVGMAVVDLNGKVILANDAITKILGYTEEELSKISFSNYTHPEELALNYQLINELVNGDREFYELEKRFLHKNGNIIWGLLHVSLVRDEKGSPLYFISQVRNITEEKHAEEKLLKWGRNMSYCVRVPLISLQSTSTQESIHTFLKQ
ncbi:MAG: PAS domain S-box protein [Bacillus sp. (in: Bacteria)]|nr:PAS domain S-box protein [Bacillus sp. (in: firmicutes)]